MRQIVLFWASCWSVLAFLFLPFTYNFLPKVGVGLSTFILPINKQICAWLGVEIQKTYLVSDSLAFYSTAFILLLFSGLITALVYWRLKRVIPKAQQVLLNLMVLLLAFFLIRYGLDKIFDRQFYTPASNTLHTPMGQLSKDILFWSSMGTSSFYNYFMGIVEVLAGTLLFFNRTRFLGLLMAFGIFGNILAINIGFDITVKYLSGLLLFTSTICLLFFGDRLKSLLTGKSAEKEPLILSNVWVLILFTPFFVDLGMTYWENPKNESGQSYHVLSIDSPSELIDEAKIVRIHLHPAGYFITEDKQQHFTSYKMSADRKFVIVNQQLVPFSFQGDFLNWREGEKIIRWKLKEIDLEELPLKKDETNWYFESIGGF
ncbi:MAG TPA: hypothetical protein VKX31_02285 [Brumimicrobium sp.]|nr:hypothetical protein [Brumimicrobium sp.]